MAVASAPSKIIVEQERHMEKVRQTGLMLAESKWSKYTGRFGRLTEQSEQLRQPVNYVKGLKDDWQVACMSILLENLEERLRGMDESTRAVAVGDFQKYAFPLVRAIFPELVANSLVSVQPMLGPTSMVFYLDFVFGSTKGSVTKGTTAFSSVELGPNFSFYSSPTIDSESIGTGGGSAGPYTATLTYTPVIPGTFRATDGTQVCTDDGNGTLVGTVSAGTINYITGAISITWTGGTSAAMTATYDYDMEAQSNIPEVDLILTSSPVVARPRKLRTRWSLESAFNLRSLHGLEAEVELTSAVGSEIRFEIDREIISDLQRMVTSANTATNWSKHFVFPAGNVTDTVSFTEHKLSIIDAFVEAGNKIFLSTGRATATWIVAAVSVCNILETLPGWVATPGMPSGLIKGVHLAGTLNGRWSVFKDPFYTADQYLMGYKGSSFLEAGYIYAPYIPLYTTPTIVLDDFIGRKGLGTQYGKKAVNNRFYAKGTVVA